MKKRVICLVVTLAMLVSMMPFSVFAAYDTTTGKPTDFANPVYLAIYLGEDFPGEPAGHATDGYNCLGSDLSLGNANTTFASSADGLLEETILDDLVVGTDQIWGVFSNTGVSRYLKAASGLVTGEDGQISKPHNGEAEQKIIQNLIDNNKITIADGKSAENYTIVWYVVKFQHTDQAWHIDGKVVEKQTYSVNYYGNGNTGGGAPAGVSGLVTGDTYTVLGNTGYLSKVTDGYTYTFEGWNTSSDGTGTRYLPGQTITIGEENVALYAEWQRDNVYNATVLTKLDDNAVNLDKIDSTIQGVYLMKEGDTEYLSMTKGEAGTYTREVQNGIYTVYFQYTDGTYGLAHGHQIVVQNDHAKTEYLNYSVNYDLDGGSWASTEDDPGVEVLHANSQVLATENIPVKEGYTFLGWKDQNGNDINPGDLVTEKIVKRTVLQAQWEKKINVTVNIAVRHTTDDGDRNESYNAETVLFQLLDRVGEVYQPYGDALTLDPMNSQWECEYDAVTDTTTYSYTFTDLPQNYYSANCTKSHYTTTMTHTGNADEDQTIDINLQYNPGTFNLAFDVVVNFDAQTKPLLPKAVNVKVVGWNSVAGQWEVISQQENAVPITVFVDENGKGSGWYPVAQTGDNAYAAYRVMVTSFVMPDGGVVAATGSDWENYKGDANLYSAKVTVENGGQTPEDSALSGAVYDADADNEQNGIPTVTVDITPHTVTFHGVDGTVEGDRDYVMDNQYRYPNIYKFAATPDNAAQVFAGWVDKNGMPVENLAGRYLTGDVDYYALYSPPMTVQGAITAEITYEVDGQTIEVGENDKPKQVTVVLERVINDNKVVIATQLVDMTYPGDDQPGTGNYVFENVPNDGSEYRIDVLIHNYDVTYDNESDADLSYSPDEYMAVLGEDTTAQVDVYMDLVPVTFVQELAVDATRIAEDFRPYWVVSQVLYQDWGDINWYVLEQHKNTEPYGVLVPINDGKGTGSYSLWGRHADGALYVYRMNVTTVYGDVEGAYTHEGTVYNEETAPYTVVYGPESYFSAADNSQARTLEARLEPKKYEIRFELGLDEGETVAGMDEFLTDGGEDGEDYYSYQHTWSYADEFSAHPFRAGHVFLGWESSNLDGVQTDLSKVTVGAGLAEDVVLTAQWQKIEGTAVVVRHLEMNTETPLVGAELHSDVTVGAQVKAQDYLQTIEGYTYAGAKIGETLYGADENPELTVSEGTENNLITIYYVEEGYTDQVENNLKLDKTAALVADGTYTINLETYTKDNPVTTQILQNTPLDVVMVIDQSGSIAKNGHLEQLRDAIDNFIVQLADHGRHNEVDHRIAIVGFAGDEDEPATSTSDLTTYPLAGGDAYNWVNTGVFDSNGDFHPYTVTGFNYTAYTGNPVATGTYYAESDGEFLLLTHHDTYYHLISEEDARNAVAEGVQIYGYVYDENDEGQFVELTRNTSGLWLYGDKQLYSRQEFFTYHEDVWTHRKDLESRQIHAYGTGSSYTCEDGHNNLYTRTETEDANPQLSVYHDALTPVSVGANGSGGTNFHLENAAYHIGSNGGTYTNYGIEMANKIFEANPLAEDSGRVRVMVVFTDGLPGIGTFDDTVANNAIAQAYITKNTHDAHVYTLGIYDSTTDMDDRQPSFLAAVSSNCPDAQSMDDVYNYTTYTAVSSGTLATSHFVQDPNDATKYYPVQVENSGWFSRNWYFTDGSGNKVTITTSGAWSSPTISNYQVGGYSIYKQSTEGSPKDTPDAGYSVSTTDVEHISEHFANLLHTVTTKITQEVILHSDTVIRDIMGQGLVLTDGSVITAYKVPGTYNADTGEIVWGDRGDPLAKVTIQTGADGKLQAVVDEEIAANPEPDGTLTQIFVYNLEAENATDPLGADYHPHTVDVTGYDFDKDYINAEHPEGYKLEVEITRVEARDDVIWGRAGYTNHQESGVWLPADVTGQRELLMTFPRPKTIFVERAYVLDYGKQFELTKWYFDDEDGKNATPIHIDCNIEDGMNWFDPASPNTSNAIGGQYGNTNYGNVQIADEKVFYSPTSMNWHGYDQFYVFGQTWRKTVLAQDANNNGVPEDDAMANLWNKVTVIPANNIYYEDAFITTEDSTVNGIQGFTFTGDWSVINNNDAGNNVENPEHLESAPYGDVHGWTDSLRDDVTFSDNSVHVTGQDGSMGAKVAFTFTGTGVEVYTRTDAKSGMVLAMLTHHKEEEDGTVTDVLLKSVAIDNLAVSNDGYYHIPTVSFDKLEYGEYTLEIIATMASDAATGQKRYEYYVDGVRIYNPLGGSTEFAPEIVKDAYGLENNAVYTEVRDILLGYNDFNPGLTDGDDGKMGAVFIDWIRDGQGSGADQIGTGVPTYEIGTFETYGPKNEVYLSAGQAIVLKVDPTNHYFVGLKSLAGAKAIANVSGIDQADPVAIEITHSTDLYYQITPDADGNIVIQNGSTNGSILSVTNLRTTNLKKPAVDGGVLPVTSQEAVTIMRAFSARMAENAGPDMPVEEEFMTPEQMQAQWIRDMAMALFSTVRNWLGGR